MIEDLQNKKMDSKALFVFVAVACVSLVSCESSKTVPLGKFDEVDISLEKFNEISEWLINKDIIASIREERESQIAELVRLRGAQERLSRRKSGSPYTAFAGVIG